jgi:2-polyprenyl-6-methoxyphenol hydroxylase-like FAD-dependent oxidoreductase
MAQTEVLVAGAGPTGLNLALWLTRLGVSVRIVDTSEGPGETSRAIAVQARTLEFYRQLGFAAEAVQRGTIANSIRVRLRGTEAGELDFGDRGDAVHAQSPYAYVLILPQDEHERMLVERLHEAGVEVERGTELLEYDDLGNGIRAVLNGPGGVRETVEAAYLCGCDGAHSSVRRRMGVGFPGGTYDRLFYVADVRGSGGGLDGRLNFCVDANSFCIALPLRHGQSTRLIGSVIQSVGDDRQLEFAAVAPEAAALTGGSFAGVDWFSTYRAHHRVADAFRKGNAFLLGDAAHIHSPAGGQGMNTGIGDAANVAWKIAAVLARRAEPALLDTYESERIPFARSLVATTDRLFASAVGDSLFDRFLRTVLVPRIVPELLNVEAVRLRWFDAISQTRIRYRTSALSEGAAGKIRGGDRLPWVDGPGGGNFAALASLDWQIHVYGKAETALREAAARHGIALHEFAPSEAAIRVRLEEDALYLVRPDGHVGLAQPDQDVVPLERYVTRLGIAGRDA